MQGEKEVRIKWYICSNCGRQVIADYAILHARFCKAKTPVREKRPEVKVEPFIRKLVGMLKEFPLAFVIFGHYGGGCFWL